MAKETEKRQSETREGQEGGAQAMRRRGEPEGQMALRSWEGGLARPWSFRQLFDEFDRMFEQMQRQFFGPGLFGAMAPGGGMVWAPGLDVQETNRELVLSAELPGFEPDEIHVDCTEDTLTIRGEHREEEGEGYRGRRTFFRQITVPAAYDLEKVKASFRNGLLRIRLPKAPEAQTRRIPIESGEPGQRAAA